MANEELASLGIKVSTKGVGTSTRKLKGLEKQSNRNEKSNKSLSHSFGMLKTAIAAVAFVQITRNVVGTAAAFEKLEASLTTVTGSAEKATAAMDGITQFATRTPYQVSEITDAFIKLKSLGIDPTEEKLLSFANTSSAMGKSLNQMIEAVADAATGEFERLKQFGIKARSQGDEVSLTFQGVTTTIGKNSKEITEYLENIGKTTFAGAVEKQMNTLDGAFSNFSDTVDIAVKKLAAESGFNKLIKQATKGVSFFIRELTDTKTIDDFNQQIEETKEKLKEAKEIVAKGDEGGMFSRFFSGEMAAYNRAKDNIEILTARIVELQVQSDKLKKQAGGLDAAGKSDKPTGQKAFEFKGEDTLTKIREQYKAEDQLLREKYAAEQTLLDEKLQSDLSFKEEHARLSFQISERQAADEVALTERVEKEKATMRRRSTAIAGSIADNLSTLMTSKNKKLFEIGKIAATSSAIINTAQAVTKTMSEVAYPWNIALAAAQGIAGMAQVQRIQSQTFEGGGGGSAPIASGGGGVPPSGRSGAISLPDDIPTARETRVSITLNGDNYSRESVRNLIDSINEELGDGSIMVTT